RRDDGCEDIKDERDVTVVIGVTREVCLRRRAGTPEHLRRADHHCHDERDSREQCDEQPRQDFRTAAAPQSERRPYAVSEDRSTGVAPALARTGISLIPDVEYGSAPRRSVQAFVDDGSAHRAAPAAVVSPSRWNRSASARRRGAIRRSGASDSTSASRTCTYTDSSGPSMSSPVPSAVTVTDRFSSAATRRSRLVSTSMNTVSVSFVNCPTSPDCTSRPP